MKIMLACVALLAALASSAVAEVRYDRKLEAAVKAKIAARIGDIRAGFDHGKAAVFLRLPEYEFTDISANAGRAADARSAAQASPERLTLAVERKPSRIVF